MKEWTSFGEKFQAKRDGGSGKKERIEADRTHRTALTPVTYEKPGLLVSVWRTPGRRSLADRTATID